MNNDIVVINFILCISFGYMSLIYGKWYPFCFFDWYIIVAGNFIYETIVRLLNTIDIVDAVYGLIGVLCSLIYLYYINDHRFEDKE